LKFGFREVICVLINLTSWAYLLILVAWLAAHLLTGDQIPHLALLNFLAVYLFFPLPLVLLGALICRSRSLGIGFALGALAFLYLWGPLFLPRLGRPAAGGQPLTVMTYNVLAWHTFTGPVIATIRAEDPDIVFLQELNWNLARALGRELIEEYPYQVLAPLDNPSGIGVISKLPIQATGERLPLRWIGGPQVLAAEWERQTVTLVNIHMVPTTQLAAANVVEPSIRLREAQAEVLVDLARRSGPVIIAGDANSAPLNESYKILARALQDSWREAGFGLGHTFPGSTIPGSDRPRIGRWYVPAWLARIDYIFHSADWTTVSARLARVDGVSDHRGVVAVLKLVDP
jgi:endonuclease/exonuclease/phosphatase (EEP) superfamily protein YafD